MSAKADFSDLTTRVASAVVLLIIGGFSIWQGDAAFKVLLSVTAALMAWEISRMHDPRPWLPVVSGVYVGASVLFNFFPVFDVSGLSGIGLRFLPALLIAFMHQEKHRMTVFFALLIFIAATSDLGYFRQEQGLALTLWLLLCVIASDIGGYFAGKMLGGPNVPIRELLPSVHYRP